MAKITLSRVLHRRKNFKIVTLVVAVLTAAVLLQTFVFNNPKTLQAAVLISGNDAIIDGANTTTFVVDQLGNVYQQPNVRLIDDNNNNIDFRYYSYLANPTNCDGQICNVKGKNLTVRNGQVLMEGSQSFKNLYIDKNGSVSQPVADRDGLINKPLYTGSYWGMSFTGFLKIPANSVYYLYSDDVSGGVEIDYSANTSISSDDAQNKWTPIYLNASNDVQDAWQNGVKQNLSLDDYISSGQYTFLQNESNTADKWVPIRFSYGRGSNAGVFNLKYQVFEYFSNGAYFPASKQPFSQGLLSLDRVYGISDGNPMKDQGQGLVDFRYFVSTDGKTMPNASFSNSFKTVESKNISPKASLANFGYLGGANNVFQFAFGSNSQAASPIGDSIANINRLMASRHSAYALNPTLFPVLVSGWPDSFKGVGGVVRRLEGGLTLAIDNELKIDDEKGINLTGVGFPGWGNEFYKANDYLNIAAVKNRGGGAGGGEFSTVLGGGGSHARKGGDPLATSYGTGKTYYGDATEAINKNSLGSGGGSSAYNIGGSGGGAIKIVAKKVSLNSKNAIVANGNGGVVIDTPYNIAGGAGGKIVIKADDINLTGVDSGTVKNEVVVADGFGGYKSSTGGSGGYIVIAYNITNDEVINSKSYSLRFHVGGGTGIDISGNNSALLSAEDGVLSVVKKSALEAVTIKKWLDPLDRPVPNTPPNTNFNPYSVQLNDKIRVNIQISQATPGFETTIDDEVLKVPNSTERCRPIEGTLAAPNNSTLVSNNYDSVSNKVSWVFIPNTSEPIMVSYDCQISN